MCTDVVPTCVAMYYMCARCPQGPEDSLRYPGTGVTDSCESPSEWWKLNRGPLEEQPSLQHPHVIFKWHNYNAYYAHTCTCKLSSKGARLNSYCSYGCSRRGVKTAESSKLWTWSSSSTQALGLTLHSRGFACIRPAQAA